MVLALGAAGGGSFHYESARCRRVGGFPRLQLVDCAGGKETWHSGLLLFASTTLGLGTVADQTRSQMGGSCHLRVAV